MTVSNHRTAYEYSKKLDEHREELEGLPNNSAFELMAGVGENPTRREGDERAFWQLLESDDDISDGTLERAQHITSMYPFEEPDDLLERFQWQETLVTLFESDVSFGKYDYRFAIDLINQVRDGNVLSIVQQRYLEMFTYKYREQLREEIIYTESPPTPIQELVGDDPRKFLSDIFDKCEASHEEMNDED